LDFAADLIPERQQDNSGEVSFPARESTGSSFILFRPIGPLQGPHTDPFHTLTGSEENKQQLDMSSKKAHIHPLVLVSF
jgi:hypothetical protein